MSTSSHPLCGASIALLIAAAATSSAFAQPASTCTTSPGPDCLYAAAATYGFTPFERSVTYDDHAGDPRTVKVLIRQPQGTALPMPVVIWSHGGTDGKNEPKNSMAEWSTVTARAGYFSIAIAHAPRDDKSRGKLCTSIGMDTETCNLFSYLNWDRPHDIRAVLNEVERMVDSEFRGQIDKNKVAVGGHSAGAGGAQTIAGAKRNFLHPPATLSDSRPIAFLAFSPQQPGNSGFFDTKFQQPAHSWTDVDRPMLTATGDGDDGCKPSDIPGACVGDTPFGRRIGFGRMPANGNKYQLYLHDADAHHMLFELNVANCPVEIPVDPVKCAEIARWLSSTAIAFLDYHVRQLPAAMQWLQSDRIEQATGGVAEWQRK
jgi:poly(3-hydroxybutyrate) depolymerase